MAHHEGIPQVFLPLANSDYLIYGISKIDTIVLKSKMVTSG